MNSLAAELRTDVRDGGLEIGEILVDDSQYDRACDIADAWEAERQAEEERKSYRRCPKCRSARLEYGPHETLGYVYRCKDCGAEIVFRR